MPQFAIFDFQFSICNLFLVLLLGTVALAQTEKDLEELAGRPKLKRKVTVLVRNVVPRPRNAAPIPIEIELEQQGSDMLRGPLLLELVDINGQTLARVQTPEVALGGGDKRTERIFLPPAETFAAEDWTMLKVAMLIDGKRFDLDQQPLSIPGASQRQMVIATADPWQRAQTSAVDLGMALALDPLRPDREDRASLTTMPARIDPSRLPTRPIDYSVYDLLVLPAEGLSQASARQLAAIAAWVRAGGSLFVSLGGGLAEHHAAFLNELADTDVQFVVGDEGRASLIARSKPADGLLMLSPELGRVVVLLHPTDIESLTQSPGWRPVVAHIWKVRSDQARLLASSGTWRQEAWNRGQRRITRDGGAMMVHYGPGMMPGSGQLVQGLMPASVRVIPFWVIILILALFTLAVGPGDYLVLGLLRQRKLTWVLFPCLAIGFTLVTVAVADRYMGRTDQKRVLTVQDIGADGRVLRSTQLALSFLAKERFLTEEAHGGLFMPLDLPKLYSADWNRQNMMSPAAETRQEIPLIIGRIPDSYQVVQRVYQWVPRLTRLTHIPLADQPEAMPRHVLRWPADVELVEPSWREHILAGLPAGSSAIVFHAGERTIMGGSPTFVDTIGQLSARQADGFFTVISQVSPTGGDNFEDLTILDPSDVSQRLLVIVVPEDDDYYVYRRLYRNAGQSGVGGETPSLTPDP